MKRKSRVTKRKRKRNRKKPTPKYEKLFVSNFLKQPGRTRAGTRYTRKARAQPSTESIFGSLLNASESDSKLENSVRAKTLSNADSQCGCRQCLEKRQKVQDNTCTSSPSGVNIFLRNEEPKPRTGASATNLRGRSSSTEKPTKYARSYYCNCIDCMQARKRRIEELRGRQYFYRQAPPSSRPSPHQYYCAGQWHPLEKSYSVSNYKSYPIKHKKSRRSRSLLKYVLKKRSQKETEQNCSCCKLCMEKLFHYIKEEIARQKNRSSHGRRHRHPQNSEWYSKSHNKKNRYRARRNKSDSSVPRVSAGVVKSKSSIRQEYPPIKSCRTSLWHNDNHFVRSKAGRKSRKGKNRRVVRVEKLRPSRRHKKKHRLLCSKDKTPAPTHGRKKCCYRRKYNAHKRKMSRNKWKFLKKQVVKELKNELRKSLVKNDVKKRKKKSKKRRKKKHRSVPLPRTGEKSDQKNCCKKRSRNEKCDNQNKEDAKGPTEEEIRQCIRDREEEVDYSDIEENDFAGAPIPSARVPTYIAMVKTAIRDLKPYGLTTRQAISKYIQIRYCMRNECLLQYVLRWMVNMGVLTKRCGYYSFCGRTIVRKKTVAVLRRCPRVCPKPCPRRQCCCCSKCPREECCPMENLCCSPPVCRKRKRKKIRCKRRKPPKCMRPLICPPKDCPERKCCKAKCTCARELRACKNRVKVRTRYIRKNGKIYKQEEYI